MRRRNALPVITRVACLAAIAGLTGCVSHDMSDLQAYTQEILARKGGHIEPLPEIKPYERYLYQSADAGARDPFQSFYDEPEQRIAEKAMTAEQQKLLDEIQNRNREELEQYELDSLRMVGTIENDSDLWGVIRDQGGTVHRIKVGNYMGRNFGRITSISEDRIELREIVKDANGVWEERPAVLALAEE
ncbi:MAG: pilus assembly protein PilP [Gammaproteobacteria bacterium]|nr:pilus assembly protein PilP [Gammaproteobacteria bacterium]